jgi:hypothetical protein
MTAPTTPQEQLAWKEATDAALGIIQLDLKKIPAKLILSSTSVGLKRVNDIREVCAILQEQAVALDAAHAPLASTNPVNQQFGMVELDLANDHMAARVAIKSAPNPGIQAKHLRLMIEGLVVHATELEATLAAPPRQGPPPAVMSVR